MPPQINKIYIIHYKPLTARKQYIENYFAQAGITNYEYREQYQREDLTPKMQAFYWRKGEMDLSPAQICITIEHIETYREIVNQEGDGDGDGWYLILEDDAILPPDFMPRLLDCLAEVPPDADYLDICDYLFQMYFPNPPYPTWIKFHNTRTNIGYLVKKDTCRRLLQTIVPFEMPIDHELNTQIKIHNLNVYHANKPLVFIGHHYGSSYSS